MSDRKLKTFKTAFKIKLQLYKIQFYNLSIDEQIIHYNKQVRKES